MKIKIYKDWCAMAMAGVVALGVKVAEGSSESYEAEKKAAEQAAKRVLSVLPETPVAQGDQAPGSEAKKKTPLSEEERKAKIERLNRQWNPLTYDLIPANPGEDLDKFRERLVSMERDPENPLDHMIACRSYEYACQERAKDNMTLWYALCNDEIPAQEIMDFLDEDLDDEQKERFFRPKDKEGVLLAIPKNYYAIAYALRKFGISMKEILDLKPNTLREFCCLEACPFKKEADEDALGYTYSDSTTILVAFGFKEVASDEEKYMLMHCLRNQVPISSVHIGRWGLNNTDRMESLVESSKFNRVLTKLSLGNCAIDDESVKILTDGLKCNETLTALDLESNCISSEGAKHIGGLLRSNHTLRKLNLRRNAIGEAGIVAIATAIKHSGIVELVLCEIPVTNRAAVAIEDMLGSQTSLTSFICGRDQEKMNLFQMALIALGVRRNTSLTTLALFGLDPDFKPLITDSIDSNITMIDFWLFEKK